MTNVIQFPTPASPADQVAAVSSDYFLQQLQETEASITPARFTELMGLSMHDVMNMDYDDQLLIWKQTEFIDNNFNVSPEEQQHLANLSEVVQCHPWF